MSALFLKDIKLHSPGERNFADIGGLDDVKAVFIEHLLWPIKVILNFLTTQILPCH